MRVLTAVTGSEFARKYGLADPINRVAYQGTKTGFQTLGAANRAFAKGHRRRHAQAPRDVEQGPVQPEPRRRAADDHRDGEGLRHRITVPPPTRPTPGGGPRRDPRALRRARHHHDQRPRGVRRCRRRARRRHQRAGCRGDGLRRHGPGHPAAGPSGVATTLTNFGSDEQQATYLPDFAGENVPQSAVVIAEPKPLFDAFNLATKATRVPSGYRLSGVKSFVPAAGSSGCSSSAPSSTAVRHCSSSSPTPRGLIVEADPGMGVRAAGMGRLRLRDVAVPSSAIIGGVEGDEAFAAYRDVVRLAPGLVGAGHRHRQAMLDYVIPYVNEREAFGEPISNRQAVAFMVATMATEIDGLRLVTLRGASRAEQGLSFARETALARKLTIDKGLQIGLDGVQLLGGHGFTKGAPVERWYRDLRGAGIGEGSSSSKGGDSTGESDHGYQVWNFPRSSP